ncbi:acyltransferase family protein [Serratia fonticola]|uniref:Acyltransferase n=1 Tax=Serratia fonticola TaxID=47917 RepID=A0ABY9PIY3_SERFO|nr:acyltransferase [Serratia fonticola]WMT13341.1 acyltransferase [Serratia fonticola]
MNTKNHNIQTLRSIAIFMVIVQHLHRLPIPTWLATTYSSASYWTGVDIFLAISGFLMCKSLEREIETKGRCIKAFLSFFFKRIFRLMPALIFWCLFCLALAFIIKPFMGVSVSKSLDTLFYSIFGVSNLFYFEETISGVSYDPLLSVTWSLSLEWQLYLVLALLSLTLKGKFFPICLLAIVILASILLPSSENHQESIGWWIRPQAFLLGSLIYLYQDFLKKLIRNNTLIILAFLISIFSIVYLTNFIAPAYKLIFIGLLGAIAFLLYGICLHPFNLNIFNWIGDRSYSIYLCHIPAMILTKKMLDGLLINSVLINNSFIYVFSFLTLTALLSDFSYRLVEQPFIRFYKHISTYQIVKQ